MSEEYIVDVDNLTIRFNMASEKVDNLKEYVIKLIKHELMFQEFLALKDVNLKVKRGEAWGLIGTNVSNPNEPKPVLPRLPPDLYYKPHPLTCSYLFLFLVLKNSHS